MNSPQDLLPPPDRSHLPVIAIFSAMLALPACSSSSDDDVATREPEPVTRTSDTGPPISSSTTETTTPPGVSYPIESLGTAVGLHCGSLALT